MTDLTKIINLPLTDTIDPTRVDTVVQFNLEGAFKDSNAEDLIDELSIHSTQFPLDNGVLDGRLKDPTKFGTLLARSIANKLAESVEVFTQAKGSFRDDPSGVADGATHHTAGRSEPCQ